MQFTQVPIYSDVWNIYWDDIMVSGVGEHRYLRTRLRNLVSFCDESSSAGGLAEHWNLTPEHLRTQQWLFNFRGQPQNAEPKTGNAYFADRKGDLIA